MLLILNLVILNLLLFLTFFQSHEYHTLIRTFIERWPKKKRKENLKFYSNIIFFNQVANNNKNYYTT